MGNSIKAFCCSRGVFLLATLLYTAGLLTFIFLGHNENEIWKTVALIIGAIYVFIAGYYFYDNIMSPYLAEAGATGVNEKVFDPFHKRNNILFWMMRWVLPALLIQLFVFSGFYFVNKGNTFSGSVFTHPYMYGELYKRWRTSYSDIPVTSLEILGGKENTKLTEDQRHKLEGLKSFIYVFKTDSLAATLTRDMQAYKKDKDKDEGATNDLRMKRKMELVSYIENTLKQGKSKRDASTDRIVLAGIEAQIFQIPFIIALTFSFLGTLIYTLKEVAFRLYTKDLYPNSLVNFVIRFLMAPAVSMVIAYFWMDEWASFAAPMVFFVIGFFPQIAVQYIERKTEEIIGVSGHKDRNTLSLNQLQGMTEYLSYRFKEIGIGDAQNLAYVDLPHLDNNIGYGRRLLVDMVSQALLLVHFQDKFSELQKFGIRNIISFRTIINASKDKDKLIDEIADKSQMSRERIEGVHYLVNEGILQERVTTLESLARADESEQFRSIGINSVAEST